MQIGEERLEDNYVPSDETASPEKLEEMIRAKEAHTNAVARQIVSPSDKSKVSSLYSLVF